MRPRSVAFVLALPVLLAGCDGASGDADRPSRTAAAAVTASATPTPSATPSADPSDPAAWRDSVLVALRPLTGVAVDMLQAMAAWRRDPTQATATRALLSRYAFELSEAGRAVDGHRALAAAPQALDDYRLTAALYLQAARVGIAATAEPQGPLQAEMAAQFTRLRSLADRFFDQAEAEVRALGQPRGPVAGVEVRPAAEVPDWAAVGLAAGPPLDTRPAATAQRSYQERRPVQSFARWRAAVAAAGIPTGEQERAALEGSDQEALRRLAHAVTAASSTLYGTADPEGRRSTSIRLQLGLLVHAEAARAAQAALLSAPALRAELRTVARGLAALGDRTWDSRLGPRSTGFST